MAGWFYRIVHSQAPVFVCIQLPITAQLGPVGANHATLLAFSSPNGELMDVITKTFGMCIFIKSHSRAIRPSDSHQSTLLAFVPPNRVSIFVFVKTSDETRQRRQTISTAPLLPSTSCASPYGSFLPSCWLECVCVYACVYIHMCVCVCVCVFIKLHMCVYECVCV